MFERTEEQRDAVRQRYHQARTHGSSALVDTALLRWFSDEFAQARPDILASVRQRLIDNDPHGFLPAYKLFADAEDETVAQLGAISAPTLVITGAQDVGSTPAMSARLAQCIPHARLQVLDGVKHMLPVERAVWLSSALHEFVADND